jgi:hypothetical protein
MYRGVDVVGLAVEEARAAALRDRARFDPFVRAAEEFAAARGLVLGGGGATRLLGGEAGDPLEAYRLDFLSDRAPRAARDLADALYAVDPGGLGHYTTLMTKTPDVFFEISVDGRAMFSVAAFPVHRGVRTADLASFVPGDARLARGADGRPLRLLCLGPELQLMGVYAALCNPARAQEASALLATEAALRARLPREGPRSAEGGRGGRARSRERPRGGPAPGERPRGGPAPGGGPRGTRPQGPGGEGSRPRGAAAFREALLAEFAAGPGRALVGAAGAALLAGRPPPPGRLQLVSVDSLELEAAAVRALGARLGVEVQTAVNDPKVPTDPRLRRLTAHLVTPPSPQRAGGKEAVLDVFNLAAHELVPFLVAADGLRVGTPFVLMRLRLVDAWTMLVLRAMGAVPEGFAAAARREALAGFAAAERLYEGTLARLAGPAEGGPAEGGPAEGGPAGPPPEGDGLAGALMPSAFLGRLEDPGLAAKRAAARSPSLRYYPLPYYPARAAAAKGGAFGGALRPPPPARAEAEAEAEALPAWAGAAPEDFFGDAPEW